MQRRGTCALSVPVWQFTKWLNRSFEDVSSTKMLRWTRGSKSEMSGLTQAISHAGVLPTPDGVKLEKEKFPFSLQESNSFTVVSPISAPVHGNIPESNRSRVVPWLLAKISSQSRIFRGAISSQGILMSESFDSKSTTDWISAKELMLNFENVDQTIRKRTRTSIAFVKSFEQLKIRAKRQHNNIRTFAVLFSVSRPFCCFTRVYDSLRGRRPKGKERGKTSAWSARRPATQAMFMKDT